MTAECVGLCSSHMTRCPNRGALRPLGDCALGCNVLGTADAIVGPLESLLPVDLRIPGCPPTPEHIAQALLGLIDGR